jgi:8-oxo-dGTP diphosphatase
MQQVRVGMGICIFKNGKILLGQRQHASQQGADTWCPPGGKLDFGESFSIGTRRETMEEAGVEISEPTIITVTNDIFPDGTAHYITIYFQADWISGEPKVLEPHKIAKWDWFDWNTMPTPLFSPFQNLLKTGFHP